MEDVESTNVVQIDVVRQSNLFTASDFLQCINEESEFIVALVNKARTGSKIEEILNDLEILSDTNDVQRAYYEKHQYAIIEALNCLNIT